MIRLKKVPKELKKRVEIPEKSVEWWFREELPPEVAELAILRSSETRSKKILEKIVDSLSQALDFGITWANTPGSEPDYWPEMYDRAREGDEIISFEDWENGP